MSKYNYLVVVSDYTTKKEIKSYVLEFSFRQPINGLTQLAKDRHKQDVMYGGLKGLRDVSVKVEVVEI